MLKHLNDIRKYIIYKNEDDVIKGNFIFFVVLPSMLFLLPILGFFIGMPAIVFVPVTLIFCYMLIIIYTAVFRFLSRCLYDFHHWRKFNKRD